MFDSPPSPNLTHSASDMRGKERKGEKWLERKGRDKKDGRRKEGREIRREEGRAESGRGMGFVSGLLESGLAADQS